MAAAGIELGIGDEVFVEGNARAALPFSAVVTLIALLIFGFVKGRFTGVSPVRSAWQTALIGSIAAAAAYAIASAIS